MNPKFLCHVPSVNKYISIDCCVEDDKNTEKEEKIWMTHGISFDNISLELLFFLSLDRDKRENLYQRHKKGVHWLLFLFPYQSLLFGLILPK